GVQALLGPRPRALQRRPIYTGACPSESTARAYLVFYGCSCRGCLLLGLGIGDVAAAHPRQYFRRWAPGLDGSDCRPSAKFFFVLVSYPACPIAALGGEVRQLRMPSHALVRVGRFNRPTILADAGKLALGEDDRIGSALRQKATMLTCFAAGAQSAALAAF